MALVQKENLEGIFDLYNPACYYAGNRVYWIQDMPYNHYYKAPAYPITNMYMDKVHSYTGYGYEEDEVARYEFADCKDEDGFPIESKRYLCSYGSQWRLFTLPPTAEELALPWD